MSGYRFDQLKVLIVDDNAHMRKLVSAIVRAFGVVEAYETDNAKTAWTLFRQHTPDVIVLDWVLGGMSGIDLTKMIRTSADSPRPFVPIIMLTGHTGIEHVRVARDAGINEFLAKPVSANALLTRLLSAVVHPRRFVRTSTYFGPCRRRREDSTYRGPERRMGQSGEITGPVSGSAEDVA
jgi:CheY-like chemotaxis protein